MNFLLIVLISSFLVLLFTSYVSSVFSVSVYGQEDEDILSSKVKTNSSNNTISISTVASTLVKPDKVHLSFAIESNSKTAVDALENNSQTVSRVINVLRDMGVNQNQTSTSSFTIFPNYNYTIRGNTPVILGYTVTNSLIVESPELDKISTWIDAAVSAGANRINDVSFLVSDEKLEKSKDGLLSKVIMDAKRKAVLALAPLNLDISGIKSIDLETEDTLKPISPLPRYSTESFEDSASATPILNPGDQYVSISAYVTFFIK